MQHGGMEMQIHLNKIGQKTDLRVLAPSEFLCSDFKTQNEVIAYENE